MAFESNEPYLSAKWIRQVQEYYGDGYDARAEKHRAPSGKVTLTSWLSKNALILNILGDSVSIESCSPSQEVGKIWLLHASMCSGGAYERISARTSLVSNSRLGRKELGTQKHANRLKNLLNPDAREASITTIVGGFKEIVRILNSADAEYLDIAPELGTPSNTPRKKEPTGGIRKAGFPNPERWSTEIVLDIQNFQQEITKCIKECIKLKIPIHAEGLAKYIPMEELLNLPNIVANPELLIGSIGAEYQGTTILKQEETPDLEIF